MANIIDSLLITMGLDGSGVSKGMNEVEGTLASGVKNITTNILAPLAGAFAFGALLGNFTSTADALGKLSKSLRADTRDVKAWGDAVESVGGDASAFTATLAGIEEKLKAARFGRGGGEFRMFGLRVRDANGNLKTSVSVLEELARKADTLRPEKFELLAKKFGLDAGTIRFLQSGSKEVDNLVSKYKDLAYTRKDAEIAREFNNTMGDLNKTFQAAAAVAMRILVPALTLIGDKAAFLVNFLRKHETFAVAFFLGIAAVILYALLPAITAAATAAWTMIAPFLPFIAIAALLALLINSLWVYINGGKSALSDFFAIIGTGEEISAALAEAWEDLKAIGTALWKGLKSAAQLFFSYFGGAIQPLVNSFKNALRTIKALFQGNFSEAWEHFKNLWGNIGEYFFAIYSGAFNLIVDIATAVGPKILAALTSVFQTLHEVVTGIFTSIGDFFIGIFDSILGTITGAIKSIVSKVPDFLLPEGLKKWAQDVDTVSREAAKTKAEPAENGQQPDGGGVLAGIEDAMISAGESIKAFGSGLLASAGGGFGGIFGGDASQCMSPALAAGPVDNSVETTVNVGGVVVNAQSNDPAGIARETGNELRRMTATGNKGVRQ